MNITPTQSKVQEAVGNALLTVLGDRIDDVVVAVQNRVPEPKGDRFVVMWPMRIARLRTNVDTENDVKFTGSIAAAVMTVTAVAFGELLVGATVFGTGVTANTKILDQISGAAGGVGTYTVTISQSVGSRTLASGAKMIEEGAQITVQLDFHTKDNTASDLAQTVSATFRDEYGVELFAGTGVTPLYADDPRQLPFVNEQQQAEWRWALDAVFQINQIVTVPQQYADAVDLGVISVEATYPP